MNIFFVRVRKLENEVLIEKIVGVDFNILKMLKKMISWKYLGSIGVICKKGSKC